MRLLLQARCGKVHPNLRKREKSWCLWTQNFNVNHTGYILFPNLFISLLRPSLSPPFSLLHYILFSSWGTGDGGRSNSCCIFRLCAECRLPSRWTTVSQTLHLKGEHRIHSQQNNYTHKSAEPQSKQIKYEESLGCSIYLLLDKLKNRLSDVHNVFSFTTLCLYGSKEVMELHWFILMKRK